MIAFVGGQGWFLWRLSQGRSAGPMPWRSSLERFRSQSLILSLGLTAVIGGGLWRYYSLHGAFRWSLESLPAQLDSLKIALFFLSWVGWIYFEVVQQHSLRLALDAPQVEADALDVAGQRVLAGLRFQFFFAMAVLGLSVGRALLAP